MVQIFQCAQLLLVASRTDVKNSTWNQVNPTSELNWMRGRRRERWNSYCLCSPCFLISFQIARLINARSNLFLSITLSVAGFGFRRSCDFKVTFDLFYAWYSYYHWFFFSCSAWLVWISAAVSSVFPLNVYTNKETDQIFMRWGKTIGACFESSLFVFCTENDLKSLQICLLLFKCVYVECQSF